MCNGGFTCLNDYLYCRLSANILGRWIQNCLSVPNLVAESRVYNIKLMIIFKVRIIQLSLLK